MSENRENNDGSNQGTAEVSAELQGHYEVWKNDPRVQDACIKTATEIAALHTAVRVLIKVKKKDLVKEAAKTLEELGVTLKIIGGLLIELLADAPVSNSTIWAALDSKYKNDEMRRRGLLAAAKNKERAEEAKAKKGIIAFGVSKSGSVLILGNPETMTGEEIALGIDRCQEWIEKAIQIQEQLWGQEDQIKDAHTPSSGSPLDESKGAQASADQMIDTGAFGEHSELVHEDPKMTSSTETAPAVTPDGKSKIALSFGFEDFLSDRNQSNKFLSEVFSKQNLKKMEDGESANSDAKPPGQSQSADLRLGTKKEKGSHGSTDANIDK